MNRQEELIKKDRKFVWHPYTQMKDCEELPPIPIKKAKGVKLYGYDGEVYYDTISSWWCNVHGHGHSEIIKAIKKQLGTLDHIMFAGFTHEAAVLLSEKLVKIAPKGLTKVFFSDNGSTSVEVAMKMSFQFWKNAGERKKEKFLSLDKAYHGDTIGTMSVSGVGLFNRMFEPLYAKNFKAPTPDCYRCPMSNEKESCSIECLNGMENILREHSKEIAAIIIEPLLMGAGGMIIYPAKYLEAVYELSRTYGVHLIVDEVATGFGRTGKMFASEYADIRPDFLCLSKGITAGYLPMGVTLSTDEIFRAFYDDYEKLKTFYHGHTYTANPLACAAALSSLDVFEKERTLSNVPKINRMLISFLSEISRLPKIGNTRSIGAVGAIELVKDKATKEPFGLKERIGYEVYKKGIEQGLILRPLGNVVYFFLPLNISSESLNVIFARSSKILTTL